MMSKPSNVLKLQINSNKSLFKQLYVFSSWGWVNWLLRVWSRDCYSWWCLSFFPFWLLLVCLVVLSYVMNFILGAKYVLLLYSCFMLQKCKEHWRTLPPCWFLLVILFLWEFDNFDDVQRVSQITYWPIWVQLHLKISCQKWGKSKAVEAYLST